MLLDALTVGSAKVHKLGSLMALLQARGKYSRVPWSSALGPTMFNVLINYLDEEDGGTFTGSANDTKLGEVANYFK